MSDQLQTDRQSKSALYEGTIWHQRLETRRHQFQYSHYFFALDLEELPELIRQYRVLSENRFNVASFYRTDHLGNEQLSLQQSVRDYIYDQLGLSVGRVLLLTQLRHFGFLMNPVSFYYCYHDQTDELVALLAEVNNTPWGEQHCYCFPWPEQDASPQTAKAFHVSPFFDLGMTYHWQVTPPEETLSVGIRNYRGEELLFEAKLNLNRVPISGWTLHRKLLEYPIITFKTFAAIYWQAARLWAKRVPYVPHPGHAHRS